MALTSNGTEQLMQQSENESRVPQQLGAYITCLIIAYMGVAARFLCRRMRRTSPKTEDWLILVSLVSSDFIDHNCSYLRADFDFRKVLYNRFYLSQHKSNARRPWTARKVHYERKVLRSGANSVFCKWSIPKLIMDT